MADTAQWRMPLPTVPAPPVSPLPLLGFRHPVFHHGRNTSVRRGDRWHGIMQAAIALPPAATWTPVALQTQLTRFDALRDADLADEHDPHCRSVAGLRQVLQAIYPGFADHEQVTLVHFWLD